MHRHCSNNENLISNSTCCDHKVSQDNQSGGQVGRQMHRVAVTHLALLPLLCIVLFYFVGATTTMTSSISRVANGAMDVCVDANGNVIYVAYIIPAVYQVTVSGGVQLISGSVSVSGTADGFGPAARFNTPSGVACDTANNIAYICDAFNHRIRTLTLSSRRVTTLAGGTQGHSDGVGTTAQFNEPWGIAYHAPSNVLYIAEHSNYIRRIAVQTANVTTVAQVGSAQRLCVTQAGAFMYVSCSGAIVRVDLAAGSIVTLPGTSIFRLPQGIALNTDETALIITDASAFTIRRIELSNFSITPIAGSGFAGELDGSGLSSTFNFPYGGMWYCDPSTMNCGFLLADWLGNSIRFVAIEAFVPPTVATASPSLSHSTSGSSSMQLSFFLDSFTRTVSLSPPKSQTATVSFSHALTISRPLSSTKTAVARSKSSSLPVSNTLAKTSRTFSCRSALSYSTSSWRSLSSSSSWPWTKSTTISSTPFATPSATTSITPSASNSLSLTDTVSPSHSNSTTNTKLTRTGTKSQPFVSTTNSITSSPSFTDPNCSVSLSVVITDAESVMHGASVLEPLIVASSNNNSLISNATSLTTLCVQLSTLDSRPELPCTFLVAPTSENHNRTWSVEAPLLPTTQVRVVLGFALSTSWRIEPANGFPQFRISNGSTIIATEVIEASYSPYLSMGKLGYISLPLASPPNYGSTLTIPLVARCATEHINVSITVHWPAAPAVTTATVVATTLASTAGAAFGGDVVSAASLVFLSMLSCNTLAPNPGVSGYVMSVFFDDGPVSMVTGNVGIGVFVSVCQFGLVVVVARLLDQSHDDVAATLRFPAVSIRVTDFLLPGTMYSALTAFWSAENGAVATGVFGVMVVVVALVALEYFYAVRHVLPLCDYAKYDTLHYPTGHWLEARFLFPTWQWYPKEVRSQFWPMMGPYVPGRTWVRVVTMCLALLLAAVAAMASSGVGCVPGAWTVGILHIVVAIVLVVLKPFRVPSDALLGPLGTAIIGVACCLKATGSDDAVAVSDDITTAMALVQVVRTVIGLWVQWREGQWSSEEPSLERQHDMDDGRDGLSDKLAEWDDGEEVPMLLQFNDDDDASELVTLNQVEIGFGNNNSDTLAVLAVDHTEPVDNDASRQEVHPLAFSGIEGYFIKAADPIALI